MAKFFGANNIEILDATSGVVKIGGAIGSAPFKLLDVIYKAPGANKINVIKVVREITGFGLKEAKELVDNPPKAVKEGVTKEEAEKVRKMLAEAGAEVEVK